MKFSNTFLPSLLVTTLLTLAACGDGGLCKRGEVGCACAEDDTCNSGSRCDDGTCVTSNGGTGGTGGVGGTGGTGGAGGTGGTGGTGGVGGTGGTGGALPMPGPDEQCVFNATGLCIARVDEEFPADAQTACEYYCELFCARKQQWCPTEHCPARFCDPTQANNGVTACLDAAGGDADQARAACVDQDLLECPNVDCGAENPVCPTETTCLMDCGSTPPRGIGGQWAADGVCDDGGDGSEFHECEWGHDCEACGVRYGAAPACTELSGCCRFTNDCCGGFEGEAHCLGNDIDRHCRYSCTATGLCPVGFECRDITRNDAPTGQRACVPE